MIAFCTQCFAEIDSSDTHCQTCHADLSDDPRSYEEKLVAALDHPLPEARARICWLLGAISVSQAVPKLMQLVEDDPDLFVQKASIEALAQMKDPRAKSLLDSIRTSGNPFLRSAAAKGFMKGNYRGRS